MFNRKPIACSAKLKHPKYFESPEKKSCGAITSSCTNEPVRLTITLNDIINSTKNLNSAMSGRSDSSMELSSRPRTARINRTPARSSTSKPASVRLKSNASQNTHKKQATSHIKPFEALISQKFNCKAKLSELRQIKFIPTSVIVIENNAVEVYSIRRI